MIVIDRFEGEFAVIELEDRTTLVIPKAIFHGAKEGDVINIEIDEQETSKRKKEIEKLMDALWDEGR